MCDYAFTSEQIKNAEKHVLETLKYTLLMSNPLNFFEVNAAHNTLDSKIIKQCKLLLLKSLFFKDVFKYSP